MLKLWPTASCQGYNGDAPNVVLEKEIPLDDPHQVNALIATAICDWWKDRSDQALSPEEEKHLAKCIIQALSDAGLQILAADAPKKV